MHLRKDRTRRNNSRMNEYKIEGILTLRFQSQESKTIQVHNYIVFVN